MELTEHLGEREAIKIVKEIHTKKYSDYRQNRKELTTRILEELERRGFVRGPSEETYELRLERKEPGM